MLLFVLFFQNLFSPFKILSARETTLGANRWLKDVNRFEWKTESNEVDSSLESDRKAEDATSQKEDEPITITMFPMQIRTFVIEIKNSELSHPTSDSEE